MQTHKRSAPIDRYVDAKAARLRYRIEGFGPALVLVHGVGASLDSWDSIVNRLGGEFTVLRPDLRGHGDSSRILTCSIRDFLEDLCAVVDHAGLGPFHLVGFSLGGL